MTAVRSIRHVWSYSVAVMLVVGTDKVRCVRSRCVLCVYRSGCGKLPVATCSNYGALLNILKILPEMFITLVLVVQVQFAVRYVTFAVD